MSLSPSKPSQWLPIALNIKINFLSTAYKALHHLVLACISLASSWSTIPLSTALPLHCHLLLEHTKFQDLSFEVPPDCPSMAYLQAHSHPTDLSSKAFLATLSKVTSHASKHFLSRHPICSLHSTHYDVNLSYLCI